MRTNAPVLYPNQTVADNVTNYSDSHSLQLPDQITSYHAHISESRDDAEYMISVFQAKKLVFLSRLMGAQRVLEIGVYVGFSALVFAHAVGPSGHVTGLEYSAEYAELAKAAWAERGIAAQTEVIVGDALQTLPALNPAEPYDIIFIDAQKSGYPAYLAAILDRSQPGGAGGGRLLRPGGLIIADNVLRRGLIADDSQANPNRVRGMGGSSSYPTSEDFVKLREFNGAMNGNPRLEAFLLPLWDGVGLARLVD